MSTIPEGAKKVSSGVIFDIYQREQELFDGRKAIFEMAKRQPSVYVMPVIWDRITVINQRQPWQECAHLGLLWGRAEEWEDILEAAKRELLEESGYIAKKRELRFVDETSDDKMDRKRYYYIAHDIDKTGDTHMDWGEDITLQACTFDEFAETFCKRDYLGLRLKLLEAYKEWTLEEIRKRFFG